MGRDAARPWFRCLRSPSGRPSVCSRAKTYLSLVEELAGSSLQRCQPALEIRTGRGVLRAEAVCLPRPGGGC